MATEPKFRPSLTAKQLSLIETILKLVYCTPDMRDNFEISELIEIQNTYKTLSLFNFKIGNSYTQASYIPTGTAKPKVEISDLLSESELAAQMGLKGGIDYSSTTAMHTAYKNVQMVKALGVPASPEDQVASDKWIKYCDENNLDYQTGQEK